jgi:deoxycytidine triphosphate deaminase
MLRAMSVLSREELCAALAAQPPLVEDLDVATQLQPNGIDLRADRVQRLTSPALLGVADAVREPAARENVKMDDDGWWDLHEGVYVITYRERVKLTRWWRSPAAARSRVA